MKTTRSLKALAGLLGALVIGLFNPIAAASGYYTQAGKIYDASGQEIQIRGVSHFGFNADILQPQFLWAMGWKEQIAQIKSLGFNAVRLPFVPDTLYVTTKVDQLSYVDASKNPEFVGKTPLQALDLWMAEADRQGIYVMLDFHSVSKVNQYQTWFVDDPNAYGAGKWAATWNTQPYTVADWKRDLAFVAQRYANLPHFFAIDIFNEPQGIVRWSTGDPNAPDPKNFWKPAAEGAAAAILTANPKLLIFVQGINANNDGIEKPNIPINWGENFQPEAYQPLNIASDKLVLTPHTYGPDVYVKPTFSAPNYPANLAADWETLFGQFSSQIPVVIGEWGGRYGQGGVGQADVQWQNALVDYLLSKGIHSSFYWCYTPNSGDTGGILDDNLNVRQDKMTLLNRLWGGASTGASLALSASAYTVAQSAGSAIITVNRSGSSSGAASVNYATANGTASAGTDYTANSGTLNWAAGDTAVKSFSVAISNTAPFSGSRNFSVTLSNASTATLGTPGTASVTINGSGAAATAGSLVLSASSYTVAQSAGSLTVSISRAGGSTGAISVQYATSDGTAKAGTDYTTEIGTWSWANGDTSAKTFTVPVSNATPFNGSRNFNIKLSNTGGGATLGSPSSATATINGSGATAAAGTMSLSASTYTVAQNAGSVKITVNRASGSTGAVSVRYATANGSAVSGSDYYARSGTLSWASGNTAAKSISVTIRNNTPFTGSKNFSVNLSNATGGAVLGSPSSATVNINGSKAAPPANVQPYIASFSPTSGPVGTVVAVTGSGFTGVNAAWVGNAHDASVSVASDTQVNVTIPADATTGAIGIFNSAGSSFTASSFTVTAATATYVQPYIQSFSPTSGPVGTVVTLIGSGFTGSNEAWVGNAHGVSVTVVSDTQVKVTIPAAGTTGAIGIFNPAGVSFTASSFTVQ